MKACGVLLAGGESRRFGHDKAFVQYQGSPFYKTIVNELTKHVHKCLIVTKPELMARFESEEHADIIVDDRRFKGMGPLAGLISAMGVINADYYVVVACDMPLVTADLFSKLIQEAKHHPEADAIIPIANGRIQPLCALYKYTCKDSIENELLLGDKRVMAALKQLKVRHVMIEDKDLESFTNVNTIEEYMLIRKGPNQ